MLHNDTKDKHRLSKDATMLGIPTAFIGNPRIYWVLYLTINEFNCNEQRIIYLHHLVMLPISEITSLTKLSMPNVESILVTYSQKLAFKLGVFKKAVPYDAENQISINEMFELEFGKKLFFNKR